MIERYTRPAMGRVWTEENKYRCWLEVESAASAVLAEDGVIPAAAAEAIAERAGFSVDRIHEIEAEVKHDVIAFTTAVAESLRAQGFADESRWLHYGLTSNDVVDTAQALQVKEASALIRGGLVELLAVLKRRAIEFKHTPTIGRTHGMHAEPTTFGLKLLNWYAEMERNLARFDAAAEGMRVGKLSGAVGTFGHLKPEHEERICARLGLEPAPVATQVLQRDRHAAYISTLAIIAGTLDKIAVEIRHLQRTEVREAQEYFSENQKGSSAMPHKKNPITAEQISGLARVVRGNAQAAFEDIALWHERDISHSSVERVILPDSTILADYLLAKTEDLIGRLLVYPERMKKNLESTGGLIFSGQLLLDLAEAGMLREDAYKLVQAHATQAWKEDLVFRDEVAKDPAITALLGEEKLAETFDSTRQLGNVDAIFARVLKDGEEDSPTAKGTGEYKPQRADPQRRRIEDAFQYALELRQQSEEELEAKHLTATAAEFPTVAALHGYLALTLSREGRLEEAIEHGKEAVRLSPQSEKASLGLFRALWVAGQQRQAFDEMKRFLEVGRPEEYSKIIRDVDLVTKEKPDAD